MTTTHISQQTLPSFAQAFNTPSVNSISSGNNSLPPIQSRPPSIEARRVESPAIQRPHSADAPGHKVNGKKRSRNDATPAPREDDNSGSERHSPRLVRVKEEQDHDMLENPPSPPPPALRVLEPSDQEMGAPSPSSVRPTPSKKRRVTISGGPHPLNTDVRPGPNDRTSSTPISPVVMGFTIRDDPAAIQQVRSMLTVKQNQKALIEQRRGSVAGVVSNSGGVSPPNATPEERGGIPKPPGSARSTRRSPNSGPARRAGAQLATANGSQPPSPPMVVPSQHLPASTNSLPPPPISFARRRANQFGAGKKKPADIIISPREAHTPEQFQPLIQSAPPVPHAGQNQFYQARFPMSMSLPRLPPAMNTGETVRKTGAQVPPTPTRLTLQHNAPSASSSLSVPTISGISGKSPSAASVAISSSLVPPTPTSLQHPGYSGDKNAFLAPFGLFYDSLNDSKQLKTWLNEQLQRSSALIQNLTQQQEKMEETVNTLVERKVSSVRAEMAGLYRRVDELEDALRVARADATLTARNQSTDPSNSTRSKGKPLVRPGMPIPSDSYSFPPDPSRRRSEYGRNSPSWNEPPSSGLDMESPHEVPRLSVSSARLDPQRAPSQSDIRRTHATSPSQTFREGLHHLGKAPAPPGHAQAIPPLRPPPAGDAYRPHGRDHRSSGPSRFPAVEGNVGEKPSADQATPPRSRRNSIALSPPDRPRSSMDDS